MPTDFETFRALQKKCQDPPIRSISYDNPAWLKQAKGLLDAKREHEVIRKITAIIKDGIHDPNDAYLVDVMRN